MIFSMYDVINESCQQREGGALFLLTAIMLLNLLFSCLRAVFLE